MRIYASNSAGAVATAASTRRSNGTGFTLSEEEGTRAASQSGGLRTVGGIDALIALQGIDGAAERRQRALKRGRIALDALDELKLGILGGDLTPATLSRLKSAATFLRDGSGDAGLDGVLAEIELRVEVEIAKLAAA